MCVSAAILASSLIGAGVAKYQGDKQQEQMEKQAREAEARRRREKAEFDAKQKAASATPTLVRNATQSALAGGTNSLSVKKKSSSGYNSLGTGSAQSTGLNIPKG